MEIVGPQGDRIVALEVNKNASTLFWKPNSKKKPPDFYSQGAYHRPTYMGACDRRIYHTSGWESTFVEFIESETGVRRQVGVQRFA